MTQGSGNGPVWHQDVLRQHPERAPEPRLLWSAVVDVGTPIDLGVTAKGSRYLVPILGGRFYAGTVDPNIHGSVLSGGADRQLLRADGIKELQAIYEMQLDTGEILSICNRVIVDQQRKPERYACSIIEVTAPDGDYAWLNRRQIAGTVQSAREQHNAVIIRAWLLDHK